MKARKVHLESKSQILQKLMNHILVVLGSHWVFQSLLYADPTERNFKLFLDLILTLIGGVILTTWFSWPVAWVSAFLIAHTINFIFNAQLCTLSKNFGMVSYTYQEFQDYVQAFNQRVQQHPSIRHVELRGSLTSETWSPHSDLDVRLYRHPGFVNGIRACWFLLRERSRALFVWFPLDAYIRDGLPKGAVSTNSDVISDALDKTSSATKEGKQNEKIAAKSDLFGRLDR